MAEKIRPLSLDEMSAFEQRGIPRAGLPLKPTYDNIQPRASDFTTGYNFNITQRKTGRDPLTAFQMLKFLSTEPITATLIKTRKNNLKALQWSFKVREANVKPTPEQEKRIEELMEFFRKPDKHNNWDAWLSMFMEDVLVYDAGCLYKERNLKNSINRLRIVSGASIKPLATDLFTVPEAPDPAYQQIIQGQIQSQYTSDDMKYIMANPQPDSMYGKSPVEIMQFNINLLIRKEMHALSTYTEGNIPGGFLFTSEGTNAQQMAKFLEAYNKTNKGDFARIGQVIPLPDFFRSFQPISPATFDLSHMEQIIRQMCAAFDVSPSSLVSAVTRSTAEQVHYEVTGAGLEGDKQLIKNLIDEIVQDDFGYKDIEFNWVVTRDLQDPAYVTKNVQYLDKGIYTVDEIRSEEGREPLPKLAQPAVEGQPAEGGATPQKEPVASKKSSKSETDKSVPKDMPSKKEETQTVESPVKKLELLVKGKGAIGLLQKNVK